MGQLQTNSIRQWVHSHIGVEHLLLPAQLPGTHWVMICVIRRLAMTISDVCLKLRCFQRGIALYALYKFTSYLLTYLLTRLFTALRTLTKPVTDFSWINSHRSRQTSVEADKPLALRTLANLQTCFSSSLYVIWLLSSGSLPSLSSTHQTHQLTTSMPPVYNCVRAQDTLGLDSKS